MRESTVVDIAHLDCRTAGHTQRSFVFGSPHVSNGVRLHAPAVGACEVGAFSGSDEEGRQRVREACSAAWMAHKDHLACGRCAHQSLYPVLARLEELDHGS